MKFIHWLSKTVITGVVMASICAATTWVMVNAYVQQVIGGFSIGNVQPISLIEGVSALGAKGTTDNRAQDEASDPMKETSPTPPASADAPPSDDALPVMGQVETKEDETLFTIHELSEKKDSLSQQDRMEIFSILISHLPSEGVQMISTLLENGVTAEEMQQVSAILQEHLSEENYDKLIEILMKY